MCNPFGFQFVVTTLKVTHGVVCLIHSKRPLKTLQAAILSFHNWQRRFPTRFFESSLPFRHFGSEGAESA